MKHTRNIRKILIASMITLVVLTYLNQFNFAYLAEDLLGYNTWLTPQLLINLLAGIPAILALRYFKVPYAVGITLLAIAESYWLMPRIERTLLPEVSSEEDIILAIVTYIFSYLGSALFYLLAYALFNLWNMNSRYKTVAALLIIIATGFIATSL